MHIFCMAIGHKRSAAIVVDASVIVEHVERTVMQAMSLSGNASDLELYLAKTDGDPGGTWLVPDKALQDLFRKGTLPQELEARYLKRELHLEEFNCIGEYFPEGPPPAGCVHLLVDARQVSKIPSLVDSPQEVIDTTPDWLQSYHASFLTEHQLPPIQELASFIKQPLSMKIAIKPKSLATIRSRFDGLSPRDILEKLFVEEPSRFCKTFKSRVVTGIINVDVGSGNGSESSFIYLWDSIIRAPLMTVFRNGLVDRDTNKMTSTAMGRPDFVFTLHSVCVFRGEEKAPGVDISRPTEELYEKLVWTYGDVPYLFAYAASGYECRLVALCRLGSTSKATVVEIGEFHLQHMVDRFRLLLALLQLGRLLETIALRCPSSSRGEFTDVPRQSGEVVRLDPSGARKDFSAAKDAHGRPVYFDQIADHVQRVYGILESFQVPNVDSLVGISNAARTIALRPRGIDRNPATLADLFCALRHVLEALVALHRASWMHRDIRWQNVLQQREEDGGGWFLIDFMDASPSPQVNSPTLGFAANAHAPEMFQDRGTHTTAVDLWSVGHLIDTSSAHEAWFRSPARRSLKDMLMKRDPAQRPTAVEALRQLKELEEVEFSRERSASCDDTKPPATKRTRHTTTPTANQEKTVSRRRRREE